MGQELADLDGCLLRGVAPGAGCGGEGVGAMVEHQLGVVMSMGGSLDAKAAEHGVRLPAAQELDGVRVEPGAEEVSGDNLRSPRAAGHCLVAD